MALWPRRQPESGTAQTEDSTVAEPSPPPQPFDVPELGDRVKDSITGFEGIVTMIATFLHGCIRVGVQPERLHDGKPQPDQHFDQSQLIVVERRVHTPMMTEVTSVPERRRSPGGPPRPIGAAKMLPSRPG